MEDNPKDKRSKIVIIILLVLVLALVSIIGYFVLPKDIVLKIKDIFKSQEEYTVLLDEFILNLHAGDKSKSYLKIEMALMYTDKKEGKSVVSNINKIRDTILNNLREATPEEILDVEKTEELKDKIRNSINDSLNRDIVREIYYTNLIIQ